MATPFDPFKFVADAVNDIGNGIGQTADDAFRAISQAGAAAVDGVGQAVNAAADTIANIIDQKPEPRYSETITKKCLRIKPRKITVQKITEDGNGNDIEGHARTMRMSRDGIEVLDSSGQAIESLSIANCSLFCKSRKVNSGNPLAKMAVGAYGWSFTSYGPLPGLLLGAASSLSAQKEYAVWYAEILQHSGEKSIYRLSDKSDGEELIDFLETYMRKV